MTLFFLSVIAGSFLVNFWLIHVAAKDVEERKFRAETKKQPFNEVVRIKEQHGS